MRRFIDLSNIPTDAYGKYKWTESVGCECDFDYDDVQGTIKIKDTYIKNSRRHLIVQYNDEEFSIIARSFANANLYNIIFGIKGAQFQYKIGTTIQDDKRNFTIIDREYRTENTNTGILNKKYYKLHCNVCGMSGGELNLILTTRIDMDALFVLESNTAKESMILLSQIHG